MDRTTGVIQDLRNNCRCGRTRYHHAQGLFRPHLHVAEAVVPGQGEYGDSAVASVASVASVATLRLAGTGCAWGVFEASIKRVPSRDATRAALLGANVHTPIAVVSAVRGTRTGHEVGTLPAVELIVHVAAAEGRHCLAVTILLNARKTIGVGKALLARRAAVSLGTWFGSRPAAQGQHCGNDQTRSTHHGNLQLTTNRDS